MASESLQSTTDSKPSAVESGPPPRLKFRVRFRKAGDLRLVSHHDLMHLFERTFRRADLHVHITQGFNPRPRMWFALSLALGIAGLNEVLEFELSDRYSPAEVLQRLTAHCPAGIDILSVRAIDVRTSARVRRGWYRVRLPAQTSHGTPQQKHEEACAAFLQRPTYWIERVRPTRRRVNLRPLVDALRTIEDGIEMALWITPKGAARPEEIVAAIGATSLLDDDAIIERSDLEIIDELPPGADGAPSLETAFEESQANDPAAPEEVVASSRPTAIISNPFSFDS